MLKYGKAATKPAASTTAEVVRFTESDIPGGESIMAYHVSFTGTNNDWDALNQIQVYAGGTLMWNVNELQHAALLQYFSKKAGPAAAATRGTIPFYYGHPSCSFPRGKNARVDLDKDNTGSAGVFKLAYTYNDPVAPTEFSPMYLSSDANIAPSATSARFPVSQPGFLRGICISRTTSLTSLRVYVENRVVVDLDGDQFLEAQELQQGGTVTLNEFFGFPEMPMIVPGSTFVEYTVDGSYLATDDIAIYTMVPQGAL